MRKTFLLKTMLLLCALVAGSASAWADDPTTIYLETFGSTKSNTAFGSYTDYFATTGMFTTSGNVNTHYSGSGKVGKSDLSATNLSSGYTGASGLSGIYHVGTGGTEETIIQISDINIEGYSNLSLSFGALGGASTHKINVSYIIDNGSETSLISNGAITNANWTLLSQSISGTGKSLTLIFKHKPTNNWTIRMDDIKITGVASLQSSAVTFGTKSPSISYPAQNTYSQVPTTAAGYSGTITYSMTENTAGATINSSTGEVTVTKGGSVTVLADAAAVTGSYISSSDSYTLTVNDTRAESELAWSETSANVTYGADNNTFPTLTNPHGLPVTYTSSNTNAATIDGNGVITLQDVTANTQIKAIFAGNEDYKDQTVTYTLSVIMGPFTLKDGVFDFVRAASADPFENYGSGVTLVSSGYVTETKTWTAVNVTMVTSRVSGNGYRWWEKDGTLRFYDGSKATFSVPSGYVITKIVTTGANFDAANVGTLSGSTWTGASNEVALSVTDTRNIKTITVTYLPATTTIAIQSACHDASGYYGTFYTDRPYVMHEELIGQVVSVSSSGILTIEDEYADGDVVPANTALLIYSLAPGNYTVNYTGEAGTAPTHENDLKGTLTADENTTGDGCLFYRLTMHNGTDLGFWWGNTDGAAFKPGANKAYLAVPVSAAREGFAFGEETNGITTNNREAIANNRYYNLQGVEVVQPTRGLYIVNGKKVFVK